MEIPSRGWDESRHLVDPREEALELRIGAIFGLMTFECNSSRPARPFYLPCSSTNRYHPEHVIPDGRLGCLAVFVSDVSGGFPTAMTN